MHGAATTPDTTTTTTSAPETTPDTSPANANPADTTLADATPADTTSGTQLSGHALHLAYHGTEVVTDASLTLAPGRVTGLVGPNGSGKSTLLRSLARLHGATAGHIMLDDDVAVADLTPKEFARRVTLLAQSRPTPSGVSVRDVVGYGRFPYRGRWRSGDPDGPVAVEWAMGVTGVLTMAERSVDELSGGELQRVWVATALAQQTGVVLLDEPTTFLDLRYQMEILDLTRDLADDHHVAVGLVLHDLNQAAEVADDVVLLSRGHVVATGAPADVFTAGILSDVYGIRIDVRTDPDTHLITTQPVGRHTHRTRLPV